MYLKEIGISTFKYHVFCIGGKIAVKINLPIFSTVFPSNSLMERRWKIKVKYVLVQGIGLIRLRIEITGVPCECDIEPPVSIIHGVSYIIIIIIIISSSSSSSSSSIVIIIIIIIIIIINIINLFSMKHKSFVQ